MIQISTYGTKKTNNNTTTSIGGVLTGSGTSFYPVKLWGQYFDDTEDINGDMLVNGKVTADEVSTKKISADTMSIDNLSVDELNADSINCGDIEADSADINEINTSKINADRAELVNALIQELAAGNMVTENLTVTKAAHFFELVIDKIKSSGGAVLFTPADGIKIDKVEEDDATYTLYFRATDGESKIYNMWKANDQAICQNFNDAQVGKTYNVSNKYWWSLVTTTNNEDLNGATVDVNIGTEDNPMIQSCHYIKVSKTDCDGKVNPEVGDSVVMLGSRDDNDRDRQSAIYISAYASLDVDLKAPLIAQYRGINDFKLADHKMTWFAAGLTGSGTVKGLSANEIRGNFKVSDGTSLKDVIDNANNVISNVQNGEDAKMDRIVDAGSYATVVYNDSADSDANRYKLEYNIIFEIHHYEGENMIEVGPTSLPKKFSDYVVKWHYDNRQNATTLTMPTTTNKIQIANNDIPFSMVGGNINNFQYIIVELLDTNDNKLDQLIVPVIMKSAAIFEVVQGEVARITSTVTGSLRQELNNKIISVTNSISRVEQTANGLTSTVTSHTESINTLTGDIESVHNDMSTISQRADEIKAEVTNGLLTSGIDIQAGKIELNAANTNINGNLNLKDAETGFTLYDSGGSARVNITANNTPNPTSGDSNFSANNYVYLNSSWSAKSPSAQVNGTTNRYSIGTYTSGANINMTIKPVISGTLNNGSGVSCNPSSCTCEVRLYMNGDYTSAAYSTSQNVSRQNGDNDYEYPSFNWNLTDVQAGTYEVEVNITASESGDGYRRYNVSAAFWYSKIVESLTYLGLDGILIGTSNKHYAKISKDAYELRWTGITGDNFGGSAIKMSNAGFQRSYNVDVDSGPVSWVGFDGYCPVKILQSTDFTNSSFYYGDDSVTGYNYIVQANDSIIMVPQGFTINGSTTNLYIRLGDGIGGTNPLGAMPGRKIIIRNLSNCGLYICAGHSSNSQYILNRDNMDFIDRINTENQSYTMLAIPEVMIDGNYCSWAIIHRN